MGPAGRPHLAVPADAQKARQPIPGDRFIANGVLTHSPCRAPPPGVRLRIRPILLGYLALWRKGNRFVGVFCCSVGPAGSPGIVNLRAGFANRRFALQQS